MLFFIKRSVSFLIVVFFLLITVCYSHPKNKEDLTSIDLQNGSLLEALRMMGKLMHKNIVISQHIHGSVTLHLHNMSVHNILSLLLTTHQLVMVPIGNAWFILPQEEWMLYKHDRFKLQQAIQSVEPTFIQTWVVHYAKAKDIAHILKNNQDSILSKRGQVHLDTRTNMILVIDTKKNLQQINFLIKKIDVPIQQIMIETHLASIDSDYEKSLGINFSTGYPSSYNMLTNSIRPKYSLLVSTLADGSLLDMQLTALENAGHGELLSSPRLFTANQQTATIESGEEIPYQEESLSGGTTVVFKKAVLSLKVTPQILPNNTVLLQLNINQDRPSKLIVHGIPAINTRQLTTNVLVKNGQTIVLGGIYESNKENAQQSIPYLSKIPLLGLLFQEKNTVENKRELLIFVTPKIIKALSDISV